MARSGLNGAYMYIEVMRAIAPGVAKEGNKAKLHNKRLSEYEFTNALAEHGIAKCQLDPIPSNISTKWKAFGLEVAEDGKLEQKDFH